MKKVLLTTTAFGLALGVAPFAMAQDGSGAEAANEDDKDIIIVTATRRAADVQDIPIAVTAVSPAQLEQQGVVNVQNIGSVSPSFSTSNAQTSSGTVVLRIRGVGTTSNNIGFESAVGIFVDGAYQSRPGVALGEFVDVERVEVLRGPQGTLFGRNTSAGALNITNKRPDLDEFGGFVNATYGNYNHMSVQGAVNVPITPGSLALRVTGAYRKRDGYVQVIDRNGTDIGESNDTNQYIVRGQLGFETDGGITGRISADYSKSTANCCAAIEVLQSPVETAGVFGLPAIGLGPRGGMAAPVVAVNRFDTTTMQQAVDNRIATSNQQSANDSSQWGVVGEIDFPLGENADAIYIGSYREFTGHSAYDSAFSGLDIFNVLPGGGTSIDTMTHELRFQGDLMDGAFSWLVGGYYSTEDIAQTVPFGLGQDYGELIGALFTAAGAGAFGGNPLTILSGGVDPSVVRATNEYTQNSKSWSLFTHNTLEVAEGLKLTVGLRYSDESKDGSFSQSSVNNPLCTGLLSNLDLAQLPSLVFPPAPGALGGNILGTGCFAFTAPADHPYASFLPLPRSFSGTFEDEELIYTGKVSYEFDAPVTVYASYTHGYKSGGFNLDSTAAAGGADPRFASELVDAYEVGLKAKLLDDAVTLNLAGFHEEFENFQVLEFTGAQFQTFNVPKVKSSGFELESVIRPSENLTFNGGLTYTNARYPGDCNDGQQVARIMTLCGHSLTNAPKLVSILGTTYERDMGDTMKFFINGQMRMESDRRTSTQAVLVPNAAAIAAAGGLQAAVDAAPLNPFDVQDGTVKINMRAGVGDINDAWGIEAWVTNLTNQVTRGVTFNTVLRSGSRSTFVQEPRMYGLTLRGKF